MKSPGAILFEGDDVERINRAIAALLLHITPEQVDDMPPEDLEDVLAMAEALNEIQAWQMKQARR